MSDSIIQISEVNKWYGDFQVLKDINLEVKAKEKIVVCGPSGSGKSTLIRCINRLEEHQNGSIIVDGTEISEDTKNIEQVRAEVGMVFQQFNLFPHLTVKENLEFGPRQKKVSSSERKARIDDVSEKLDLTAQLDKLPNQLSGGQQQRVSLGRALTMRPSVILFDEPLSNLDAKLRVSTSDQSAY